MRKRTPEVSGNIGQLNYVEGGGAPFFVGTEAVVGRPARKRGGGSGERIFVLMVFDCGCRVEWFHYGAS